MDNINILLRAVEPEDIDFMMECEADRDSFLWSDYRAPLSRNQLMTYALTYDADPFVSGQLRLIVEAEGKRAGILDLYEISEKDSKAYVGITMHPRFRKQGIGKKTLESLGKLASDRLGLKTLVGKVSCENYAGEGLFRSAGYDEIAVLPAWHKIGRKFHDFHLFICKLKNI